MTGDSASSSEGIDRFADELRERYAERFDISPDAVTVQAEQREDGTWELEAFRET